MPVCRWCGVRFPGRVDARYCSDACRQAAYRKRKCNVVTDDGACSVSERVSHDVTSVTGGALPLKAKRVVVGDPVKVIVSYRSGRGWREVG
jgi:hypothetical protein